MNRLNAGRLASVVSLLVACGGSKAAPAASGGSTSSSGGGGSSSSSTSSTGGGGSANPPAQGDCPAGQVKAETGCIASAALTAAQACISYSFSDDPHPGDAHKQQENGCLAIAGVLGDASAYLDARCKANDAGACHALGMLSDKLVFWYVEGLSLPPCSGSADCWSFLVAEWDQPFQGATADAARATTFYDQACTLGRPDACEDVARLLTAAPTPAPADVAKASAYYAKACAMGRAGACAFDINAEMKKSMPDPALFIKALIAFKKACDDGSSSGCNDAGVLLATGRGAPKDVAGAVQLLDKGCGMGGASSCGNLVYLFLRHGAVAGTSPDFGRAQPVLQSACDDGGDFRACHALGWMLDKGVGVTADHAKGRALVQKACANGASCPK